MSLEPSPSSRQSHSPSPILSTKFSSIDPGNSESSNSSFRRSWRSQSQERAEQSTSNVNGRTSGPHGNRDGRHHAFRDKARKSRDSGGFLLHNSLGSKRKRPERQAKMLDGTASRQTRTEEPGQEDIPELAGEPLDSIDREDVGQDKRASKGKARTSLSSTTIQSGMLSSSPAAPPPEPVDTERLRPHVDLPEAHTPHTSMDASQIVRMALNLSESRRMSLSPGNLASTTSSQAPRVTSAGQLTTGPLIQNIGSPHRGSLRHALQQQQQRQTSISPGRSQSGSHQSRNASGSPSLSRNSHSQAANDVEEDSPDYHFSAATFARAEKARKYMELSYEHRRLLSSLPPLKPMASKSRKTRQDPTASRTSADTDRLGRAYNPLQYIRNRRVRARERQMFDAQAAGWNNLEKVRVWVDDVQTEAQQPGYIIDDTALLPEWTHAMPPLSSQEEQDTRNVGPGTNKTKRYKLDWSFDPGDLLGDAYWVEQGDHKALIESRYGDRIFEKFQRPKRTRISNDVRRHSYEPKNQRPRSDTSDQSPPDMDIQSATSGTDQEYSKAMFPGMSRNESKVTRVKRRLLRRRNKEYDSESNLDESEDEVSTNLKSKAKRTNENTGPLEKHLNKILADESRHRSRFSLRPGSPVRDDPHARRGGVSEQKQKDFNIPTVFEGAFNAEQDDPQSPSTTDRSSFIQSPRISMGDVRGNEEYMANGDIQQTRAQPRVQDTDANAFHLKPTRPRSSTKNFLRRHKTKERNKIEEMDFADKNQEDRETSPPRSYEYSPPATGNDLYLENNRRGSEKDRRDSPKDGTEESPEQGTGSTTKRFFKAGRIGEIVRSEKGRPSDSAPKRRPPTADSKSPLRDVVVTDTSEDELKSSLTVPNRIHRRSISTDAVPQANYHIKNLPSFVSSNANKAEKDGASTGEDHISRQLREQREGKRQSRFERFALPKIQTPEISPNNSSPDLSRYATGETGRDLSTNRIEKSPKASRSPSRSPSAVRATDRRLNAILREPGGVGKGGLPVTGLAGIDAKRQHPDRKDNDQQMWNIADGEAALEGCKSSHMVTYKEIAYVRALLLSSGVKARGITTKADAAPEQPQDILVEAARTANVAVPAPVARRRAHVGAAKMLDSHLESNTSSLQTAIEQFRNKTCAKLQSQMDDLRDKLTSNLSPTVRTCSDDAEGFIARLTTTHTLSVKQVNDGVTQMLRNRRRRLRWLSKAGFTMLEWTLVGLMWWIWLFVSLLQSVTVVVMGVLGFIKWLLWLS